MKKCIAILLSLVLIASVGAMAAQALELPMTVTVTFDLRNGTGEGIEPSVEIERGGMIAKPAADPTHEGQEFYGWYNYYTNKPFNFEDKVYVSTKLYARWIREGSNPLFVDYDIMNVFTRIADFFKEPFAILKALLPA